MLMKAFKPTTGHFRLLFVSITLMLCVIEIGAQAQEQSQYVRFIGGDAEWEGQLETAVVTFVNEAGVKLNLVAAVHLGEEEYYAELNEFFTLQDVVLYELVAEPNQIPVRDGRNADSSFLGFIQQALADFLNVSFQLNSIDYGQPNFLHADLTPSQLEALMESKNENFFTMFLNLAMAQAGERSVADGGPVSSFTMMSLLQALNADNQNAALKYLFAEELGRSGGLLVSAELEQRISILGDRNQAALRVLEQTLQDPGFREISVFYGAAHMAGLERQITAEMGFRRTAERWITAWIIP